MIDSSEMQAIVQQALKVKAMVAEAAIKAQEDPAVVRARELAHGTKLKEEALKQKIRGLASSRSAHVALGGAGIDDDFARLIAKELGKALARKALSSQTRFCAFMYNVCWRPVPPLGSCNAHS